MKNRGIAFLLVLVVSLILIVSLRHRVDSEKPKGLQDREGFILKPYTETELDGIIHAGMTRRELFAMFGPPRESQRQNGDEEFLEYSISLRNMKRPLNFVLQSFRVVLSNDVVCGWEPRGHFDSH